MTAAMQDTKKWARRIRVGGGLLGALAAVACSDDATVMQLDPPAETPAAGDPAGPVYALHTMVYNPDDSVTSYVTLTDTLDLTGTVGGVSGREFASYAFITPVDGKLLVSDGENPTVTRYEITPDLLWQELETVSFAGEGVTGSAAGFERHWFASPTTAYVTLDITKRVVWNPREMQISGVMEDSALELERDGLQLDATFNRQPRMLRGPVLKPFYYRDSDWFRFGPTTPIAVYDPVTHVEQSIVDVPCPALEVPSQDEAGNTYFSAWTYGPTLGLYGMGPMPCVRRIAPDGTLDAAWAPDLSAWTEGRPVQVLRYMRDGKAVGTVLHTDEVNLDFTTGYDADAAAELDAHWRLWLFDLEAQTARPIENITGIASTFSWSTFGDRSFVFVPDADYASSTVYELDTEGNATPAFETEGFVSDWVQVR